jgi:hypothetical protein
MESQTFFGIIPFLESQFPVSSKNICDFLTDSSPYMNLVLNISTFDESFALV